MIDHDSVSTDVPLAPMTTYKVGGNARWFAEPSDLEELRSVLLAVPTAAPVVVLGRGSNVVISDHGIDGLVIRLAGSFLAADVSTDGSIVAGGAVPLPRLARLAADNGRSGLGFYVGIPGSVGGAVRMNAGGHGSDTAAVLEAARVVHSRTAEITTRPVESLGLGYRTSNIASDEIVVQASFHSTPGDRTVLDQEIRDITRWRRENQPGGTFNAGSVFKNPEGKAAGQIIDDLGLKGMAIGPVRVSPVHANFMEATSDAKATDIAVFVRTIQTTVHERVGIMLEPEIRFLGSFDGTLESETR